MTTLFTQPKPSTNPVRLYQGLGKLNVTLLLSVVVLALFLLSAALPTWLAPYDPNEIGVGENLAAPSSPFLMGTDEFGRDILSRIVHSSQIELLVCLAGVGLAAVLGVTLGLLSGYRGGWFDAVIMRLQEAFLAFPAILFAILVAVALGSSALTIILTVGVIYMPRFARLVRGLVLVLKEQDFVTASHASGANERRILLRHILPNCLPPILVQITLAMGTAILIEAGLSYLGLGIQPPTATWGNMLQHAQSYPAQAPWYVITPGLCVFLVVLSLNTLGDTLRDRLDPRLRGV
ncbi:MAG: ABC transporter permease [Caldilineaceae bacterium]